MVPRTGGPHTAAERIVKEAKAREQELPNPLALDAADARLAALDHKVGLTDADLDRG